MSESADANESFEVGTLDGTNPELSSNDGGEDSFEQSVEGDPVYDMTQDQVLDQGYSPPDYEPKTKVPTEALSLINRMLDHAAKVRMRERPHWGAPRQVPAPPPPRTGAKRRSRRAEVPSA